MKQLKKQLKKLSDYRVLLQRGVETYTIVDEAKTITQLGKIIQLVDGRIQEERINEDVLNTIGLYIDNLKTFDTSIILPEGKTLIEVLK